MTTDDDLDLAWRNGLTTAAGGFGADPGVRSRVAARVRHRRHRRRAASAGAVAALAATAVVGVAELHPGSGRARVATTGTTDPTATTDTTTTTGPATILQVHDGPGGALRITFPGHDLGDPPSITVPSGVVRFVIHDDSPGHDLRIEDVPGFDVALNTAGETITKDVTLAPGRVYVMYCTIPGHREAGESVIIVAR